MFPSRRLLPLLVVAGVGIAACSSGESALKSGVDATSPTPAPTTPDAGSSDGTGADTTAMPTTTVAPLADLAPCPTDALADATGPIDVVFWHGMTNDLEPALVALTDEYNASQDKVRVELQNQTGYESLIDKYINARPDQSADAGAVHRVLVAVDLRLGNDGAGRGVPAVE